MDKNDNIVMISKDIRANERYIRELLADCGDIQIRKMRLGDARKVDCLMVYIEVATSNMLRSIKQSRVFYLLRLYKSKA